VSGGRHSEFAFETAIEAHLLANGYVPVDRKGIDCARAIFPDVVLGFIRETQPKEWAKLEALHGDKTGEQVLTDLCKWMDSNGSLATLRHGFKCYGRTLQAAYFKAAHGLNPELETRYAANRGWHNAAAAFLQPHGAVARCHDQPQRHSHRHGRTEESLDRPDRRGCAPAVPA